MKFNIEVHQWNVVSGWLFAPGCKFAIQVWNGDACVAEAANNRARPDVAADHPNEEAARVCGFRAPLSLPEAEAATLRVTACALDATGARIGAPVEIGARRVLNPKAARAAFPSPAGSVGVALSAFPRGVEAAAGGAGPAGADASAQRAMAVRVKELFARAERAGGAPELTAYIRFLAAIKSHFEWVVRYFPSVNEGRGADERDLCATPNSAREMWSIAHHLYVLKSHGIAGDFAEFGCFKGFSSAMLSYACGLIGVKMHIFDSFAGLPASDSRIYKAGDYKGSLEEVRRNVAQFGDIGCVTFHEGYFSQSVPRDRAQIEKLACLWMDVDLYDSARDVLGMFAALDPRGALFSHECVLEGDVIPRHRPNPDDPLPAIVEAYDRAGIEPAARHLFGATSAFWSKRDGAPVLDSSALMDVMSGV